mmetsp:Transcript_12654/g.19016  ORF Transcript_12654/g.19016 Transcript_12654/m.19016 type:complete len:171 (-) Transcript_12654:73-585(-)
MSRIRMPHNNRMSASTALRTNDMWSKTIGHDPYGGGEQEAASNSNAEIASASLMLLAKMSNLSGAESRGGCKKCGQLGHLTFQCRNVDTKANEKDSSESSDDDDESVPSTKGHDSEKVSIAKQGKITEINNIQDEKKRSKSKKEKSSHKHKRKHKHKEDKKSSKRNRNDI